MTFSDDAYLLRLSSDAIPNIHKTLAATGRPTKGRVPHFENCYFHGQVLYDFACDFKSISSKWKKILGMHAISVQNGLFKQQLITVNSGMFINCSWEEPMLVWYLRIPFFCFYLADKNVLLQKCRQRRTWIEMWKKIRSWGYYYANLTRQIRSEIRTGLHPYSNNGHEYVKACFSDCVKWACIFSGVMEIFAFINLTFSSPLEIDKLWWWRCLRSFTFLP